MSRRVTRGGNAADDLDIARGRMRLLLAAAAVFVLVAGLTVVTVGLFKGIAGMSVLGPAFGLFFITGVLLFAASAFINTEMVKTFLNATGMLKGAGE